MNTVIKIENLWKKYRLGVIGYGSLTQDLQSWWHRIRGREDPNQKIGGPKLDAIRMSSNKEFWALEDINLDIQQGDILGIIGENGAGKSTLLKILSRVTAPTRGIVRIKGNLSSLLEVGTGFHPELTGRENIFLNGAILGMAKSEVKRNIDAIIDFSGVEEFIDTPVKRYSSGMYVRLAFAVAAHLNTEIILVDEVLAVGDASFQRKCLGKMKDVSKSGRTVLFVSHNMGAIDNLCHKAIVLRRGRIAFRGDKNAAIHHYLNSHNDTNGQAQLVKKLREGNGIISVTKIVIEDEDGVASNTVRAGKDLNIYLHYTAEKAHQNYPLKIGISVRSYLNTPIFYHHNLLTDNDIKKIPQRGAFVFKLKRLPLPVSSYKLDYSIRAVHGTLIERLNEATSFQVIEGSFYKSNQLPSVKFGCCLIEGEWGVVKVD